MLADHVDEGAALHRRLHRGAAQRGHRVRRDGRRRATRRSSTSSRSRPTRRRCPASPTRSLASMGIYIFNADYLYDELEQRHRRPGLEPRLRQGHHPALPCAAATRWRIRSTLSCVGNEPGDDALLARRRHDRRVLGGQHRPHRDRRRELNLYDTRLADLDLPGAAAAGQVRAQPAATAAAWRIESMVSGGCIISGALYRSLLFSSVRVHSYATVDWSVLLPGRGGRPQRAPRQAWSSTAAACFPTAW